MSHIAMAWAYSLELPHTAKMLLAYLAFRANKKLICWPKQETMAAECGLSERSVRKWLTYLIEDAKLVAPVKRRGEGGRYGVTQYRIKVDKASLRDPCLGDGDGEEPIAAGPDHHRQLTAPPPANGASAYIGEQSYKSTKPAQPEEAPQAKVKIGFSEEWITLSPTPSPKPVGFDRERKRFTGIPKALQTFWEKAFPHLNVDGKLTEIEAWAHANPDKLARQMRRKGGEGFLVDCLALANERMAALKAGILKPGAPLPRTAPAYPFACA